jgi:hypothetical protein
MLNAPTSIASYCALSCTLQLACCLNHIYARATGRVPGCEAHAAEMSGQHSLVEQAVKELVEHVPMVMLLLKPTVGSVAALPRCSGRAHHSLTRYARTHARPPARTPAHTHALPVRRTDRLIRRPTAQRGRRRRRIPNSMSLTRARVVARWWRAGRAETPSSVSFRGPFPASTCHGSRGCAIVSDHIRRCSPTNREASLPKPRDASRRAARQLQSVDRRTGTARTGGSSSRAFDCRSARPCSSSCPTWQVGADSRPIGR